MEGKIFGVPLAIVLFIVLILAPELYMGYVNLRETKKVEVTLEQVLTLQKRASMVKPTPEPLLTPTGVPGFRAGIPSATSGGTTK